MADAVSLAWLINEGLGQSACIANRAAVEIAWTAFPDSDAR